MIMSKGNEKTSYKRGNEIAPPKLPFWTKGLTLSALGITLAEKSCLTHGHAPFTQSPFIQWLVDVEYKSLFPSPQLGTILKRCPSFRILSGLSEIFVETASQPSFSPCPVLLSSLPPQVLTPRTFLFTNFHFRICILENFMCNIYVCI